MFLSHDQNLAARGVSLELDPFPEGTVRDHPERLVDWARSQQRHDSSVVHAMWIEHMSGGYYERCLICSVVAEFWLAMQPRTTWVVLR